MSAITKERIEQLANGNNICKVTREERIELARIALASLEAEPVALRDERSGSGGISKKPGFNDLPHGAPLYTAHPAPVSVPDERAAFNAWNNDTDCPLAGRDAKTAAWLAWSRRAAMLQGAEPVQGWIPCSERMPDNCDGVFAWSGGSFAYAVEAYFDGSWYRTLTDEEEHHITHWMPLPAAPQREGENV
ncbi:TPA: DUF551 domain-containing protein [Enterobacter hormaechei subsp. hormaechei]|nr:DUF551 domain-containing protein [Enterobacter hormaechei subsp. hormaechei]